MAIFASGKQRLKRQLESLPPPLSNVSLGEHYRVHKSIALLELAARVGLVHAEGPGGPTCDSDAHRRLKDLQNIYADGAAWNEEDDLIRAGGKE